MSANDFDPGHRTARPGTAGLGRARRGWSPLGWSCCGIFHSPEIVYCRCKTERPVWAALHVARERIALAEARRARKEAA